jgi:adenine phosphoribosyltransferase
MHILSEEFSKYIHSHIPIYPNWPKDGVNYINTVELCKSPEAFNRSVQWFTFHGSEAHDVFAADARGFIWGSPAAIDLNVPLHVIRKTGKLPGNTWSQDYELEYGTDTIELLANTQAGDRPVLIVDDVLATGGTAEAMCKLLHDNLGIAYSSMTLAVLVNLTFLSGEHRLRELGVNVFGLINE